MTDGHNKLARQFTPQDTLQRDLLEVGFQVIPYMKHTDDQNVLPFHFIWLVSYEYNMTNYW
jgi:hypothetical protein